MLASIAIILLCFCSTAFSAPDPEVYYNITQAIKAYGYPCEEHDITTKDGYILGIQRIPHGRNGSPSNSPKPVVFLQHGLLDSAHTWVNNLPHQSLGFILADAGYDVWLGNSRGNTYSRRHVSLNPKHLPYWKFSWDEMAEYDLPAVLYHILNTTGVEKMAYVGHSQGTMIAFAKFDTDKALASRISVFIGLGPVTNVTNIRSPIRYVAPFTSTLEAVLDLFGKGLFFPSSMLIKFLGTFLCKGWEAHLICDNIIFLLAGYDSANTNVTRLPIYVSHTPAGTSVQNMVHYSQAIMAKQFQKFDYGHKENMIRYNQTKPPHYSVSNFDIPTALFWGGQDWLADPDDVRSLIPKLPRLVHSKAIDYYNHLDFVWGMDAHIYVYPDILNLIKQYGRT